MTFFINRDRMRLRNIQKKWKIIQQNPNWRKCEKNEKKNTYRKHMPVA